MIIAVTNLKGGSGKTAVAVNLAAILAKQHRTLVVDLDAQADASLALGVEDSGERLSEVLLRRRHLLDAVEPTEWGLDLLAAGEALSLVSDRVDPAVLARQAEALHRYEVVVVDCAPGLDPLVAAGWSVADRALVPIDGPEALRAVPRLFQGWADLGLALDRIRIVPTKFDRRRVLDREMVRQAVELHPERVYGAIRESVAVREAAGWRQPLVEYAPSHEAVRDLRALATEVMNG